MKPTPFCARILYFVQFARARACRLDDVLLTQFALISKFYAFPTSDVNYKKSKA